MKCFDASSRSLLNMSNYYTAISLSDVSRVFLKRYRHPRYRVMEAFGLPLPKGTYDEFWALRNISLNIATRRKSWPHWAERCWKIDTAQHRLRPAVAQFRDGKCARQYPKH